MVTEPELVEPGGDHRGVLVWRFPSPPLALSSAAVGGGLTRPQWLLNVGVGHDYARTDLRVHATEIAAGLRLAGAGTALLTAAPVDLVQRAEHDGVRVWATVGVSRPTWAADAGAGFATWRPGTINTVVALPRRLELGALVHAVITATEAKTQALVEADVPGTGTASDAVVVLCPPQGPAEPFGGPRSRWGQPLALAVHTAVRSGLAVHP